MTDEIDNIVPDDDNLASEKPDAVVILEESKDTGKSEEGGKDKKDQVVESGAKDAAAEGVEALAKNLEKAKKEAETERTARIAAESRATEAETTAKTANTRITAQHQQNIDANRTAATSAKAAAETNLDKYKKQAAELMAEGKFDEAEEARLSAFEAKQAIKHADNYLAQLDRAIETIKAAPVEAERPRSDSSGTVDPVTGTKFTPKTYAYIQEQGDNWKDQDFRVACDAAQKAANRKGIKPDTDEWVSFMDEKLVALGFKEAPAEGETVTDETEHPRQPLKAAVNAKKSAGASTSPAPSRAVPGSSGVAKKGVKLSGAERDVAQAIIDSVPELFKGENPDLVYARNKQALLDEFGDDHFRVPTNNGV